MPSNKSISEAPSRLPHEIDLKISQKTLRMPPLGLLDMRIKNIHKKSYTVNGIMLIVGTIVGAIWGRNES